MTTFLSRAEVHPNPSRHGGYFLGVHRQPNLVQHHTPGQDPTTYQQALEEYHQIYGGHVANGWNDFGYNFLIWDQYIFEGRGFGWTGAHAPGANSISLGVAFIMDGRFRIPTAVEYQSFHDLARAGVEYGYLALSFALTGHRDWVSTACPGDLTYAHLDDFWTPSQPQTPSPTGKDTDVYEFKQRPNGPISWNVNGINYGTPGDKNFGGAHVYDFHDVHVGDRLVMSVDHESVNGVVFNLLYPNGKQTEARALNWGQPARFDSEQAGFVSVLVQSAGGGHLRITGERK